jgi:protein ImuB
VVTGWAGPWPLEERWWEAGGRRKAWLQVLLDDGAAYLLARQAGRWWVEASYE